jgi:hypothetical protein
LTVLVFFFFAEEMKFAFYRNPFPDIAATRVKSPGGQFQSEDKKEQEWRRN